MSDYVGIAAIIGASGGAFASTIAAVVSVINLNRGAIRDAKLDVVHDLVNGQSVKLEALTFKAGEASGADKERANPTTGNIPRR